MRDYWIYLVRHFQEHGQRSAVEKLFALDGQRGTNEIENIIRYNFDVILSIFLYDKNSILLKIIILYIIISYYIRFT